MLQTEKEEAGFFPMIILFYAREETDGSATGVDLFWGYSEPYIQDGFFFEGEGVELNKIYPGKTPHRFQLL